jgi:hypothetical protein
LRVPGKQPPRKPVAERRLVHSVDALGMRAPPALREIEASPGFASPLLMGVNSVSRRASYRY